jgi:hypothetical protein
VNGVIQIEEGLSEHDWLAGPGPKIEPETESRNATQPNAKAREGTCAGLQSSAKSETGDGRDEAAAARTLFSADFKFGGVVAMGRDFNP